jgi:hypothetical protein
MYLLIYNDYITMSAPVPEYIDLTTYKETDTLLIGQTLKQNEYLKSRNGYFIFHLHTDGLPRIINAPPNNVTKFYKPKIIWVGFNGFQMHRNDSTDVVMLEFFSTNYGSLLYTHPENSLSVIVSIGYGTRVVIENNGNLVLYNSANGIVWQSNTAATMYNLSKYKNTDTIYTTDNTPPNYEPKPYILYQDESIRSNNGLYYFYVNNDGYARALEFPFRPTDLTAVPSHLEYFSVGGPTGSDGGKRFIVQTDGNLIVKAEYAKHKILWSSNPNSLGGYKFVIQDDRNLCFYNSNNTLVWHSNTATITRDILDGTSIKCNDRNSGAYYRWSYGKLMYYPNESVANSWDTNWRGASSYNCQRVPTSDNGATMTTKPPDGSILKCDNEGNKFYRYTSNDNKITHYPYVTDTFLRQYNNYTGTTWSESMATSRDCNQYNPDRGTFSLPSVTTTNDNSIVKCYDKNHETYYEWKNTKLIGYPSQDVATSWGKNFNTFSWKDCTNITPEAYTFTSKPDDGAMLTCSDRPESATRKYRYSSSDNKITYYPYATPTFLIDYKNQTWDGTTTEKDCRQYDTTNMSTVSFPNVSTTPNGTSIKCYDKNHQTVYRWQYGKLMGYPNESVATSWDSNWINNYTYKDCTGVNETISLETKPNDGSIFKCTDTGDLYYRYDKNNNQLTYYPRITDAILRQYNGYNGTVIWNDSMVATKNCIQYDPERPELNPNKQIDSNTEDGTPLMCYKQDRDTIYRYTRDTNSLSAYPNLETANTWDTNYTNYKLYDCSNIWQNNSGVNYNLISSKPSDGSIINDNGRYYRYDESTNKLLLYETPAIAKQYSAFQTLQDGELNISTGKRSFASNPYYDANKTPTYTFYFECCIEKTFSDWRIIMNHGVNDFPAYTDGRRPGILITGSNSEPANRLQIVHSTDSNNDANIYSNFIATPGEWFTCCFIVNRNTMFTYFNGTKDKQLTDGSNFNWGSKNKGDWYWNFNNTVGDGFIKVRNVRFWPFVMALEWPQTFVPFEITDEINPYSLLPTGAKVVTTKLPPPTNCKAFARERGQFVPTQLITSSTIKDGVTLKCSNSNELYRYNQERNKLFRYPTETIAQSWDPSYNNYKAYDCGSYLNNIGTMEQKPGNNNVIRCTDDNKSYRFVKNTNSLEWYKNDTIIKQYNDGWNVNQRSDRNCDQFKINRTVFVPTQNLSPDTTSLQNGTALTCDNSNNIYSYNKDYDVLMEYQNEIAANSWDPTAWTNYYSYTCDPKYMATKSVMKERPAQNTVIKCSDMPDNKFYYTYNHDDNTLQPYPDVDSIKKSFPEWNTNNIQMNDCRQYILKEPRFYDGPNGNGEVIKLTTEDYKTSNDNGCKPLPFTPTETTNRSIVRDGENIVLYTDKDCKNIYKKDNGNKQKGVAVNIEYSTTNSYGNILKESNPSHYKIVSNDEYNTLYATNLPINNNSQTSSIQSSPYVSSIQSSPYVSSIQSSPYVSSIQSSPYVSSIQSSPYVSSIQSSPQPDNMLPPLELLQPYPITRPQLPTVTHIQDDIQDSPQNPSDIITPIIQQPPVIPTPDIPLNEFNVEVPITIQPFNPPTPKIRR